MIPNDFLQEKLTELTVSQLHTTKRKIKEIILHCSATAEGKNFHASDIDRWHKAQGWNCIGYNYIVDLDGTIEVGRNIDVSGAHAGSPHNSISMGICYIGGCDNTGKKAKDTRTPSQKESLYKLVHDLLLLYPNAKVICHNQLCAKACPSFKIDEFQREYHLWSVANKVLDKINN